MSPVGRPAADPAPPFLRMERKGDPGDGEKQAPGEGEGGHAGVPQSCHRPLMLRLLNAAVPHHFQPRTLHPPEVRARSKLSDYSRQGEVFRRGIPSFSTGSSLHMGVTSHHYVHLPILRYPPSPTPAPQSLRPTIC